MSAPYNQISVLVVPTVASLKALQGPAIGNGVPIIFLQGLVTQYDGGEGWFEWLPFSTAANDNQNVIASNWDQDAGRWVRVSLFDTAQLFTVSTSVSYALTNLDSVVLVNASTGPKTITLQNINVAPEKRIVIKKVDSSANAVTISGNANIDGSATYVLYTENQSIGLTSNGTIWSTDVSNPNVTSQFYNNYDPLGLVQADANAFANGTITAIGSNVTLSGSTALVNPRVKWNGGVITRGVSNFSVPGYFDAPDDVQVFDAAGTGTIGIGLDAHSSPLWLLASFTDNSTESSTAFQAATNIGATSNNRLRLNHPQGTFLSSAGLMVNWPDNVLGDGFSWQGKGKNLSVLQSNITNGGPLAYIGDGGNLREGITINDVTYSSRYDGATGSYPTVNEESLLRLDFCRNTNVTNVDFLGGKNVQLFIGENQGVHVNETYGNGNRLAQYGIYVGLTYSRVTVTQNSGSAFAVGDAVTGAPSTATGVIMGINPQSPTVYYVKLNAGSANFAVADTFTATGKSGTVTAKVNVTGSGNGCNIVGARLKGYLTAGVVFSNDGGAENLLSGCTVETSGDGVSGGCVQAYTDRILLFKSNYENRVGLYHVGLGDVGTGASATYTRAIGETFSSTAITKAGCYAYYASKGVDVVVDSPAIIVIPNADLPTGGILVPYFYQNGVSGFAATTIVTYLNTNVDSPWHRWEFASDYGRFSGVLQVINNGGGLGGVRTVSAGADVMLSGPTKDIAAAETITAPSGATASVATTSGNVLFLQSADNTGGNPYAYTAADLLTQCNADGTVPGGAITATVSVVSTNSGKNYVTVTSLTNGAFTRGMYVKIVGSSGTTTVSRVMNFRCHMTLTPSNTIPFLNTETLTFSGGGTATLISNDQAMAPNLLGSFSMRSANAGATRIVEFPYGYRGQIWAYVATEANTTIGNVTNVIQTGTGADITMASGDVAVFVNERQASGGNLVARILRYYRALPMVTGLTITGDAGKTLVLGTDTQYQLWNTALTTTSRAVAITWTGAKDGDTFYIERSAAATGATPLIVASLISLMAGQYCTVTYSSTLGTGYLSSFGNLYSNGPVQLLTTQYDIANSAVLAQIGALTATVRAGAKYRFKLFAVTTVGATGGMRFGVGGTATATSITVNPTSVSDQTGAFVTMGAKATALSTAVATIAGQTGYTVVIEGSIVVNAGGTLFPQFAQSVSNGTNSSVLINSYWSVEESA